MNTKKRLYLTGLLLWILFSICSQGIAQPTLETKGPVITSIFAIQEMEDRDCGRYYGSIWKIYIEAEDPDRDMEKIALEIDQVGFGQLGTSWIYLKPEHKNYLKGYLQWDTSSERDGAQIRLGISVIDKVRNVSKEAVFRLTCKPGGEDYSRPGCLLDQRDLPAPFDQGNIPQIGHINIKPLYDLN